MEYNYMDVQNAKHLEKPNFIGFYHEYDDYGCFSNWYQAPFQYARVQYSNTEQFMMYHKVLMFHQYDLAQKVLESSDPAFCKKTG